MPGYGTDQGLSNWLAAAGLTMPATSSVPPSVLRQQGSDYIDAVYGARFKGQPTGGVEQERAFPRTGAVVYGDLVGPSVVPTGIVNASYRAAYLIASGGLPSSDFAPGRRVKREKVDGAAEREFFDDGPISSGSSLAALDSVIDGLMQPFLMPAPTSDGLQALWAIG